DPALPHAVERARRADAPDRALGGARRRRRPGARLHRGDAVTLPTNGDHEPHERALLQGPSLAARTPPPPSSFAALRRTVPLPRFAGQEKNRWARRRGLSFSCPASKRSGGGGARCEATRDGGGAQDRTDGG